MQMKPIAAGIASLGRGNDKMLVHMTPGEVAGLQAIAMKHGGSLTINPHTGLPEAGFLSSILPTLAGVALMATPLGPAIGPWGIAALTGGLTALSSGSLSKGLMAGLGAFGGAGLGGALSNAGLDAVQQEAIQKGIEEAGLKAIEAGSTASGNAVNEEIMRRAMAAPESMVGTGMGQMNPMEYARLVQGTGGMESMLPGGPTEAAIRQSAAEAAMNAAPGANSAVAQQAAKVQWNAMDPVERLSRSWEAAKSGNVDFSRDIIGQAANKKEDTEKTGLGGWGGAATTAGMALAPALAYGATQLAQQPTLRGLPSIGQSSVPSGYERFKFNRSYNPVTGQFEGPGYEYLGRGFYAAEGGTVPNPNDMYPQASIDKSAYAVSAQTPRSSEVLGNYSPNIDPFSGEQRMASGGIAETYGTPYQYTALDTRPLKNVSDSQLSLLAEEADDAPTQAAAIKEQYRRNPGRRPAKSSFTKMASGGIAGLHEYAAGGRLLDGPGDGMSDSIPAVIKGPKPQRAALADGEFVIPADVVSHLGNGSTKAGAQRLYKMMDKVRMARVGTKKQGKQINADRFVPA